MLSEPWPTRTELSREAFLELGYAQTSAGITRQRESYLASWREHGDRNKAFILRAAAISEGETALVIGAGKLYDIPLRALAERFRRLVLVDVDLDAMAASVNHLALPNELRRRVALVQADVTGINEVFLERARAVFERTAEDAVHTGILELLHSYRLASPPELPGLEGGVDASFSSMVLSQLGTSLTQYLRARYARRFPDSQRFGEYELQVALGQFTHRVQLAHVRAMLRASRFVVVTTDVAESTAPSTSGARLPLIGAASLAELFPAARGEVAAHAEWWWEHLPASSNPPGTFLHVHGVAFLESSTSLAGATNTRG
jgi:hypothetical protein